MNDDPASAEKVLRKVLARKIVFQYQRVTWRIFKAFLVVSSKWNAYSTANELPFFWKFIWGSVVFWGFDLKPDLFNNMEEFSRRNNGHRSQIPWHVSCVIPCPWLSEQAKLMVGERSEWSPLGLTRAGAEASTGKGTGQSLGRWKSFISWSASGYTGILVHERGAM